MIPLHILSTGKALPSRRITASFLDAELGHRRGTVMSKGGVAVRYFAAKHERQSELAARALHDALQRAGADIGSVDLLLATCAVQEQALPSTASAIAAAAGLPAGTPAFDINASCLSFLAALEVAAGLLATGTYKRIALVAADLPSRGLDWDDPESSYIFGDGAACAIVERGDGTAGINAYKFKTYPKGHGYCQLRAGGTLRNPTVGVSSSDYLFQMDGKAVFKLASAHLPDFLDELTGQAQLVLPDIDVVVPHQASHLAMKHLTKRLGLAPERIVDIYESHGNQVGASMPTALHEAFITGRAARGSKMLLLGTAAGLSLGGAVLTL